MIIVMQSMFKYVVRKYHIFNPLDGIELPCNKSPEIRMLDEYEQEKLQEYIAQNQNKVTLGVSLSMTTRIRIGELCTLHWQDVDLEKRILTVRKTIQRIQTQKGDTKTKLIITEPKSESSCRKIPIPKGWQHSLKNSKTKVMNICFWERKSPSSQEQCNIVPNSILFKIRFGVYKSFAKCVLLRKNDIIHV